LQRDCRFNHKFDSSMYRSRVDDSVVRQWIDESINLLTIIRDNLRKNTKRILVNNFNSRQIWIVNDKLLKTKAQVDDYSMIVWEWDRSQFAEFADDSIVRVRLKRKTNNERRWSNRKVTESNQKRQKRKEDERMRRRNSLRKEWDFVFERDRAIHRAMTRVLDQMVAKRGTTSGRSLLMSWWVKALMLLMIADWATESERWCYHLLGESLGPTGKDSEWWV
jgi:hypothetical protein